MEPILILVEALTSDQKERLEEIYQLLLKIENGKPFSLIAGLITTAVLISTFLIFNAYIPQLMGTLGFYLKEPSTTKDFLLLILLIFAIACALAIVFFYSIFKPKSRRAENQLAELSGQNTTKEVFRKLKKIQKAKEKLGGRVLAGTSLLNNDLINSYFLQHP